jgi:putative ABC transport system permease protein
LKKEYFSFALKSIRRRRVRSWLTMIGIFIGIASVVSLIALGQGVKKAVIGQFDVLGKDKLFLSPGSDLLSSYAVGNSFFTEKELALVEKSPGVSRATGMVYSFSAAKYKNEIKYTTVMGLPTDENPEYLKALNIQIHEGRFIKDGEKGKAIIGSLLVLPKEFFQKAANIGDSIEINGNKFEIVGIMAPIGNPVDDSSILISLSEAQEILGKQGQIDMIVAQATDISRMNSTSTAITKALRRYRGLREGDEDFSIATSEQLIDSFNVVLDVVQFVVLGIAAISLVVGGIGIMNTMYTSVLERTKDIGIMKAVGAKNSDILFIFLIEAGILGIAGGLIGLGLGIGLAKFFEAVAAVALKTNLLVAQFSITLIIGSLLFSFFVGVLSGILPAKQASGMKVTESIRFRL